MEARGKALRTQERAGVVIRASPTQFAPWIRILFMRAGSIPALGSCLPSFVSPKPLLRMLPDISLQDLGETGRVIHQILLQISTAREGNLLPYDHLQPVVFSPQGQDRKDRRPCPQGQQGWGVSGRSQTFRRSPRRPPPSSWY